MRRATTRTQVREKESRGAGGGGGGGGGGGVSERGARTVSPPSETVSAGSSWSMSEFARRAAGIPEAGWIEFHSKKCVQVVKTVSVTKPCSHPVLLERTWYPHSGSSMSILSAMYTSGSPDGVVISRRVARRSRLSCARLSSS